MSRLHVDLNCDMGEGFPQDLTLMGLVSSANIACGGHAGDEDTMARALRLCRAHGVNAGAHPGFADREGFGRKERAVHPLEIEDLMTAQVGGFARTAAAEGVPLSHVKLHGALYSIAARDPAVGAAVLTALENVGPCRTIFLLSGSPLVAAARGAGWTVAEEAFADRAYLRNGTLAPRGAPGALVTDPREIARRALRMVRDGVVECVDGSEHHVRADTICIHGDEPGAVESARAIRALFGEQGVEVRGFASP